MLLPRMFRKKDPNVQGECLKMKCGRYKIEKRRKVDGKPSTLKEILREKRVNESRRHANNNHDCNS